MSADVVLYCFDTMADWEYAYVTTVLGFQTRDGDGRFRLRTASIEGREVRTLGGLRLLPDAALGEVAPERVGALVLPGGNTWGAGHGEVLDLARTLLDREVPVAAICGATQALARAGLLEHHAHIVDADDDFPDYPGSSARSHGVVAHDGPLITAVGEAPLEFSRALFLVLGLEDERGIDEWYASFKDVPDARAARHG